MSDWLNTILPQAPALGALGVMLWLLATLAFTVLAAAWVGRDATSRGLQAPWAFCLATAFQPLVVLLVYLMVRESLVPAPGREARTA